MSVLRILRVWLFSLPGRGLAVQVPPELGDSTFTYCYFTFLWNSFVFIVLKHLHCFKLEFYGMVFAKKIVCNLSSLPSFLGITDKMSFVFRRRVRKIV
jgi:hypothetical protein